MKQKIVSIKKTKRLLSEGPLGFFAHSNLFLISFGLFVFSYQLPLYR